MQKHGSQQTNSPWIKKERKSSFFTLRKVTTPVNIEINNTSIESIGEHREKEKEKYIKFLNFKIDNEITLKYHIKEIMNKTAKCTYALALKYTLPKKTKLMIYHSLMASRLL